MFARREAHNLRFLNPAHSRVVELNYVSFEPPLQLDQVLTRRHVVEVEPDGSRRPGSGQLVQGFPQGGGNLS